MTTTTTARIGFGYDHKSNDFKILKLIPGGAYIYRLRNDSWSVIELNGKDYYGSDPRTRRYILVSNNALHWKHGISSIRALDLGTEEFYDVPLPDGVICPSESSHTYWDFTDLNGCLHLVKCKFEKGLKWTDRKTMRDCHISMEIWIMKEYGVKESWTKLLHYSSDEFSYLFLLNSTRPITFIGDLQPLVYAYKSNQQKILLGLEVYPTSFFSCDLQTRKVEKVHALCKLPDESDTGFYVVPWTCSSALS